MTLIEKIKLLFSIKKPTEELIGEVKQIQSGWKTVPFWLSVLTTLGTIAAALSGYLPAATALIITTAITVLYNIVRAIQNAGSPGVQPLLLSTRFWMGTFGILSAGLMTLKNGGVDPKWVETAIEIIAVVMGGAQAVGMTQPDDSPK